MRVYVLTVALAICAALACMAPSTKSRDNVPDKPAPQKSPAPDWLMNPPSEPGKAFYGVGSAAYKDSSGLPGAQNQASTAARRQIADTISQSIEAVVKSYASQVVADGEVVEESLSTDVMRAITNQTLSGAKVVKYHIDPTPDSRTGLTTVYALAKLSFEPVAAVVGNEMKSRFQNVRDRAEDAFAELEARLAESQKQAPQTQPGRVQ